MLAKRERFASELEDSLGEGNEAVIAQLQREGLQSDRRAAEALCRRRADFGDGYLREKLREHNVMPDLIEDVIREMPSEAERMMQIPARGRSDVQMARYLASHGFEEETILAWLERSQ
jgi:SOS response regulatory protein OraA/RecX